MSVLYVLLSVSLHVEGVWEVRRSPILEAVEDLARPGAGTAIYVCEMGVEEGEGRQQELELVVVVLTNLKQVSRRLNE